MKFGEIQNWITLDVMRLPIKRCVDIRTLNLKPGMRDQFRRLYVERALPLLQRCKHDVVARGPSLHDENTYYVIRRFDGLQHRERSDELEEGAARGDPGFDRKLHGCRLRAGRCGRGGTASGQRLRSICKPRLPNEVMS